MLQDDRRRGHRFEHIGKLYATDDAALGQRHQPQLGRNRQSQCPFRADHDSTEVEGFIGRCKLVEVIAADPALNLGIADADLVLVFCTEFLHYTVTRALEIVAVGFLALCVLVERLHRDGCCVGEHHF